MKIKSLIFTGIGITLFSSAGYASRDLILGTELTPLSAAEFITPEALMTAYISTDQSDWEQLATVGIPSNLLNDSWQKIEQKILAENGLNYATDIQPWLGNIAFALLPCDESKKSSEPEFLGIVGIKQKYKAYQFLQKIEQETKNIQQQDYRSITIVEIPEQSLYTATIGDRLLFSDQLATIKQGIDTYKGVDSLADDEKTKAAFTAELDLTNSLGQIYLTNYSGLIESAQGKQADSRISTLPIFDEVEYLVMGFGTQENSLKGRSLTKLSSGKMTQGFTPSAGNLLNHLPEDSIAVFNGSNINQIWSNTVAILAEDPNLNGSFKMFRGWLKTNTGVDLERDIFHWMDGEYTFALVPTKTAATSYSILNSAGVLLLETKQPQVAQQSLVKFENLGRSQTGFTPTKVSLGNKTMTQWQEPNSGFALTYGWLDDQSLMLTVGQQLPKSVDTKSFKNSEQFRSLAGQLPPNNLGFSYLDFKPVAQFINTFTQYHSSQMPPETAEVIELINTIDSIAATSTVPDSKTIQGEVAIRFRN